MFFIQVDYPNRAEESRLARETTGAVPSAISKVITGEELIRFQQLVRRIPVPDHIYDYVVDLVRRSRPVSEDAPEWIKNYVTWGAGPRAIQYLIIGAKARAALHGSYLVRMEDVEALAEPVLIHRVLTNFHAESEGFTSRKIVHRLIEEMRKE
jgi:MoxR-like ATPase